MRRNIWILAMICLLILCSTVSYALKPLTDLAEKETYYRLVAEAKQAWEQGMTLTSRQEKLLKNEGILQDPADELDLSGGPDNFGYMFYDSDEPNGPTYNWIDITGNGTQIVGMGDDDFRGPFDLPFNFPHYGNIYNQVYICSNGYLMFGGGNTTYSNTAIPNAAAPNNAIYFFWDDVYPPGGGQIWYGEDEDGNWVCSFNNVALLGGGPAVTLEVILYNNGNILMQYQIVAASNNSETIGIENAAGNDGLQVSLNTTPAAYPSDELAILFTLGEENASVSGIVIDGCTEEPLAEVDVNFGGYHATTDEEGFYEIAALYPRTYTVTMNVEGYAPFRQTNVLIEDGENEYNFELLQLPTISVDPEQFTFQVPWNGQDSDILTISNLAACGADLLFDIRITYLEEELLGFKNPTAILARREANLRNVQLLDPALLSGTTTPGVTFEPGYIPQVELDEGPYLILSTTSINNSVLRAFNELEVEYTHIPTQNFGAVDMTDYGTVIIAMDGGTPTVDDFRAFFNFAVNGGTSIYLGGTNWASAYQAILEYISHTGQTGWITVNGRPQFQIVDPNHDLSVDLPETYNFVNDAASFYCVRYNDPEMEVAAQNGDNWPCLLYKEMGDGTYLAFTNSVADGYWGNQTDYNLLRQIIANMLEFSGRGWLTVEPNEGSVAPDHSVDLEVTVDAAEGELLEGIYEALIEIESNDPENEITNVWVTLLVGSPGVLEGAVTDSDTGAPIVGAEVIAWEDGVYHRSVFTNDQGQYHMSLGTGTWDISAVAADYYDGPIVQADVVEGETTILNLQLDHEIAPEITIDPDNFVFDIQWGAQDSDILTIGNIGGLNLEYSTYITYLEEENLARFQQRQQIRQRIAEYRRTPRTEAIFNPADFNGAYSYDLNAFPSSPSYPYYGELDDPYFLVLQDQVPWWNTHQTVLTQLEIPFDVMGSGQMGTVELEDYTVIMIASTQSSAFYTTFFQTNGDRFEEWIRSGGWLEFHGCTQSGNHWTTWDGVQEVYQTAGTNIVVEPDHPIMEGVPATFTGTSASHNYISNVPDNALVIATTDFNQPTLIEYSYGRGNMLICTMTLEYGYQNNQGAGQVMSNMIAYCAENAEGPGGWLTLEPMEGVIEPDQILDVELTVDAVPDSLFAGTYEAMIEISAQDGWWEPEVEVVWVTLTVQGGPPHHQFIDLRQRYFELISMYFDPVRFGNDAEEVFGGLESLVIVYQDNGHIYIPGLIDNIGETSVLEGYRLLVNEPSQLHIQGDPLDPMTEYPITAGAYNWIGYPFNFEIPVDVALESIEDNLDIVMNDQGELWIPGLINTMGNMTPGEGYMILTTANVVLIYNAPVTMNAVSSSEKWIIPEVEDAPTPTGLPYPVLVYLNESVQAMQPAVIEIFAGAILVGKR